jgi:hypothetical protein
MNNLNRWLRALLLGCALAVAGAAHATDVAKQLTNYIGCVNDPLPTVAFPFPNYKLVQAPEIGFAALDVWRYPCLNNPANAMILMRIQPNEIGIALVTGSNIYAIQNGMVIGPFNLLQTTRDVAGYRGYLDATTTFILAQTSLISPQLDENMPFTLVFSQGYATATLDIPVRGYEDSVYVSAVEYFNTIIKHYFMTANAAEIAMLDHGGAGAGWTRTGQMFSVAYNPAMFNVLPVCRFYAPVPGPNTHFYTLDHLECVQVNKDPSWIFEGIAFYATPPVNDAVAPCSFIQRPVYRLYNQRAASNDSNHRYVVDKSLIAPMLAQGWILEGVVMCVPLT